MRAPVRGAKYSDDENNFLIKLKEDEQLGWMEIRRRFLNVSPDDVARACKSITVRSSRIVGGLDIIILF